MALLKPDSVYGPHSTWAPADFALTRVLLRSGTAIAHGIAAEAVGQVAVGDDGERHGGAAGRGRPRRVRRVPRGAPVTAGPRPDQRQVGSADPGAASTEPEF